MHRVDNSKFLLYLEFKAVDKAQIPINDEIVEVLTLALKRAKSGAANYSNLEAEPTFHEGSGFRGIHITECHQYSDNHDFLLENGMITNSLAPYYLQYYRHMIPQSEMDKVNQLVKFYFEKGLDALESESL